jgi:integrase
MQLSRRLSDAGMTEKEFSRTTEQARTRRKAWAKEAASSQHCSNAYTDATKSVAGSSHRANGRAYERGRVCNTRPNPAISSLVFRGMVRLVCCRTWSMKRWIDFSLGSIVYVKEQMGHSSIQVTVDTYGHLIQVRWLKAPGSNTTETSKVAPP